MSALIVVVTFVPPVSMSSVVAMTLMLSETRPTSSVVIRLGFALQLIGQSCCFIPDTGQDPWVHL
jgi:hypothetical protein